jgi:hypothetical protein
LGPPALPVSRKTRGIPSGCGFAKVVSSRKPGHTGRMNLLVGC